jgi:RNA polymerase sigma-70 factor (ECF subfamily)
MYAAGQSRLNTTKLAADLLREACEGSLAAQGQVLQDCRQYLLLIAQEKLDDSVRVKVAVSDVVQDTLIEAHRDFEQFAGRSPQEFRAWLRQILLNNLANTRRHYREVKKRRLLCEVQLDDSRCKAIATAIADSLPSPSQCAIADEEQSRLARVLATLSDDDQLVIDLRHRQQLSFREIGQKMNRSADATRMLWWRAFERLAAKLESPNV